MTVTNHILAGALIGMTVHNPIVAALLAFASHFVMDALPHFGYAGRKGYSEALKHKLSYGVAGFTLISSVAIVGILMVNREWFALMTGLVAASPDAVGLYNYLMYERRDQAAQGLSKLHIKTHRAIQWCERPWGVLTELATSIALSSVLWRI
ncbi:MAG TPA: hypothetical protein VK674_03745 [Candidatus Limnocylindria bacterium]|nr:hypothetical protein [Candidatus Limnocylindria bacterium]